MEKVTLTKKDIVESPKDMILDAVIIEANRTKWEEIIPKEKINKFEEPKKEIIQVKFEVLFEEKILKGEDTMAYYDKPMSNSKVGMFLNKYESFVPGTKIKVLYDSKGFGSIKVD